MNRPERVMKWLKKSLPDYGVAIAEGRLDEVPESWYEQSATELLAIIDGDAAEGMSEPMHCMKCNLLFDSADKVQSVFHESSCNNILRDHGRDFAQEVGRRLHHTIDGDAEPVGFLAEGGTYIDAGQTERLRIHREEGFDLTAVHLYPPEPSNRERLAMELLRRAVTWVDGWADSTRPNWANEADAIFNESEVGDGSHE